MSFVVDPNPTFTHTVKVRAPVDGGFKNEDFKATFRVMPLDELKEYDLSDGASTAAFLRKVIVSLSDLVDPDKKPLTYNDELRDLLLNRNYVRKGLSRTYFEAVSGAQVGN